MWINISALKKGSNYLKMYNIFSSKSKKQEYLEEGEPPPKKLVTEGDILIKTLSEKQLKTNLTLEEQLVQRKEFISSEKYSDVTNHVSGKINFKEFQLHVDNVEEFNTLSKNLSDKDIEIYKEFKCLGPDFWVKHKKTNKDVLYQRIKEIEETINTRSPDDDCSNKAVSRHQQEYLNSLKPQSSEIKLLKFASENKTEQTPIWGPMDELSNFEQQMVHNIKEYSSCDLKKIQKKARSMGNKIINLQNDLKSVGHGGGAASGVPKANSLWDLQDKSKVPKMIVQTTEKSKKYGCQSKNLYTIKDGCIVKLNVAKSELYKDCTNKPKLSVEEIKNIPKFANYSAGTASKVLFLKNVSKSVTEGSIKGLLKELEEGVYHIKIMNGRMKGTAFIEFQEETQSSRALQILNGVFLEGKHLVVEFGKRKEP